MLKQEVHHNEFLFNSNVMWNSHRNLMEQRMYILLKFNVICHC